jgi:DNA polymerase/3'-5' exonuclease PolX
MSATELRVPLDQARALAVEVEDLLRGSCLRLEVAGSIRRGRPDIGDLELVAIPRVEETDAGLFGDQVETIDQLAVRVDALLAAGVFAHRLDKNGRQAYGPRYKRLTYRGIGLDLFVTTPTAWGVIFLIRTGPHEFSQKLVTTRRQGGWMPNHLQVADGYLQDRTSHDVIDTPEEIDVFRALSLPWLEPSQRKG